MFHRYGVDGAGGEYRLDVEAVGVRGSRRWLYWRPVGSAKWRDVVKLEPVGVPIPSVLPPVRGPSA